MEAKDCDLGIQRVATMQKSSAPLEMYTLPSQSLPISEQAFKRYVSCHQQDSLIVEAATIDENSRNMQEAVSEMDLIQRTIDSEIDSASESDRPALIKQYLETQSPKIQKAVALNIALAPESDRPALRNQVKEIIEKYINIQDPDAQKIIALMIPCVLESDRPDLIKQYLEIQNPEVQQVATSMIRYAPLSERLAFIKQAIDIQSPEVQQAAFLMMQEVVEPERKMLFDYAISKGLSEVLIASPLYSNSELNNTDFKKKAFIKTGSKTTLIGGELKGKSILRQINPKAFLSWQKIYENYELWQKAGFDYVPIEPIQSYFFDKNKKMVNVFSGVLDVNLRDWFARSSLFRQELEKQKDNIIRIIDSEGIKHGHLDLHDRNFCLCFFRNKDGSVNFDKQPRIYAIDFDQAVSR